MARDWVRAAVGRMAGYTPGEQPGPGQRVTKLNTNENPYPPSERVMEAIRRIDPDTLRRYPSPRADLFRTAAARVLGVEPQMIMAGNGSDDVLTIATRTFIGAGDTLACPEPTYSLYPVLAQIQEARYVAVPWDQGWALPIDALAAAKPQAVYVANPNAPTGTFVAPGDLAELAGALDGVLLIDEAYADFAQDHCLKLVRDYPNVIIARSFSKGYSLAGLRFGFAVAREEIIAQMNKVKDSYNCDAISIAAATAAIADQTSARQTWEQVRQQRGRLTDELRGLGWSVLPSQANFILADPPGGVAQQAQLGLKAQGVLVRYFDMPGLRQSLRITIGTAQDNDALLAAVKQLGLVKRSG